MSQAPPPRPSKNPKSPSQSRAASVSTTHTARSTSQQRLQPAAAIDAYYAGNHLGAPQPSRSNGSLSSLGSLRKTTSQRSDSAKSGRFSLVGRVFGDFTTLRERTSQTQLAQTGNSTTATSPRGLEAISSGGSSAACSPQEESNKQLSAPADNLARASTDYIGPDRRRPQQAESIKSNSDQSGKMHQTSSRLLRMTDDDRPYTKDFMDLFSTLVVSLPLSPHRVRFQRVEHSFTSEEAINNLGSLKFSQSNRMPDPKDPSRIVTTTTTTTFSMAKEMARAVCQRFLEARFIEAADGKPITTFPLKGPVWQLTPKGITILQRFCQRNGIQQSHVLEVIDSSRNTMTLVILEREVASDRLSHDPGTISVIFRRFAGATGPNIRATSPGSDGEPAPDEYYNGLVGVRQQKERRVGDKVVKNTFTGKQACDWLMDCTSIVDRRETYELADEFVKQGMMEAVVEDKVFVQNNPAAARFQPTRSALYAITAKGRQIAGWERRLDAQAQPAEEATANKSSAGHSSSATNNNRLLAIVQEPSLRLLFREYLINTHCEENLSFYLEVREFTDSYDQAERAKAFTRNDAIRESLASAYGLYNAFLAPGSPNELNIDHNLRNGLAGRMTRAVGDDESMLRSLQEVVNLFKDAQNSVFKLMSSDSVPKFLKDPKFARVLKEYNFDQLVGQVSAARGDNSPERNARA